MSIYNYSIAENSENVKGEILEDYSASGRKNPWREKKLENQEISRIYHWIDENEDCGFYWRKKAERLDDCATRLLFDLLVEKNSGEVKKRLQAANFCRVRMCPMCAWRRARKVQAQMYQICEGILQEKPSSRWIFLTLTIPNCSGEELSGKLNEMFSAWHRFQRFPEMRKILGWYRALEITHNLRNDTYHPHFHCVLCVPRTYFEEDYILHERWLKMWQQAMQDEQITQVDIRAVRSRGANDAGRLLKSLSEACKYTLKFKGLLLPDQMQYNAEIIRILDAALHKRRLIAFGGLLKEMHKKLNLDDAIDGDLAKAREELPDGYERIGEASYLWHAGYSQYYSE